MSIRSVFRTFLVGALLVALPITSAWATHRSEAEQAIEDAKAAHAAAQTAGVASEETASLIEEAEAIMPDRQFTKARELAMKAMKQDNFAIEQAQGATVDTDAAKQAEAAIAAAEAARKKAGSVGGEWRDTGKLITEAQDLAKSGDFAAATALADKARRQGEMGYEQAIREQGATFPTYVKKPQ
ncbi:hypothetical protein [Thiocapsa marina]|uniref:SoxXA-binding protein SoxK n=1 Tax=Thiocapsa marina 5811 TaxID=768671 RepID=F9UI23_9GAMM|nr:hypothetical protein [Thiocapsa marina]EGV16199.1 hypothetical protein ThimaDRAFT_4576 [Thiocapsa marina 5811]